MEHWEGNGRRFSDQGRKLGDVHLVAPMRSDSKVGD
jgi:hypothetical protein